MGIIKATLTNEKTVIFTSFRMLLILKNFGKTSQILRNFCTCTFWACTNFSLLKNSKHYIWVKVFWNESSKICGKQLLSDIVCLSRFFKGCLPQILLVHSLTHLPIFQYLYQIQVPKNLINKFKEIKSVDLGHNNMNFPCKSKTVKFTHSLMSVIRYNLRNY